MLKFVSDFITRSTGMETPMETQTNDIPQNQQLSGSQIKNSAGGYVWKVSDINRLKRFLILGAEGGTYYVSEQKLGAENAQCIKRLIDEGKGEDAVKIISDFSVSGRAAKQNTIIFALAYCARQDTDKKTKQAAYKAVNDVLRIPTHLFTFIENCEALSKGTGWGRAHRRAIQGWYNKFGDNPGKLAMHVTKYKNRNGWAHRDVLRLAHVKPVSEGVGTVIRYVIKGLEVAKKDFGKEDAPDKINKTLAFLQAVEDAKVATHEDQLVLLISGHGLVREHIPTTFLNSVPLWRALLQSMPMTAMIRNLGKMSAIELIKDGSEEAKLVIRKLNDEDALKQARIHPFNVLVALKTYERGKGEKGSLTWSVNRAVVQALNSAFYLSFKFVQPTGKRFLLAVDVSGSMECGGILGSSSISPRDGAAALSMVTARTEQHYEMVGFSHKLVPLPIDSQMNLETVMAKMSAVPMGGTDCAQPMIWAKRQNKKFDCFVVYTDCETWAGAVHPAEALKQYRNHAQIFDAKLIVIAMTSNGFTIADPDDPGMLDMAGFDSAGPEVMRSFVMGEI